MTEEQKWAVLKEVSNICLQDCSGNCLCCRIRRVFGYDYRADPGVMSDYLDYFYERREHD
jgi:hypothetical protein